MIFKEQLQADAMTFLNPEEFGEPLNIDGVQTCGLWDDISVTLTGDVITGIDSVNNFGLLALQRVLYVISENNINIPNDYQGISTPHVDQRLCINNEYWQVMSGTQESLGILKLVLQRIYS